MSDRRVFRWATTSARLLAATVASVAAVVAVVTAISIPWPTIAREPVSVWATPAPAATVIVCDGGLLTLGRDLEDAAEIAVATTQSVTSGVSEGAASPAETRLVAPGLSGGDGPLVFTAQPENRSRVDVAASGSATVAADDLAGFAASACRPPLMESWLVGGSGGDRGRRHRDPLESRHGGGDRSADGLRRGRRIDVRPAASTSSCRLRRSASSRSRASCSARRRR